MATEERLVKIMAWSPEPAKLSHSFDSEQPCPVLIHFEKDPARVQIQTSQERPLFVAMETRLSTGAKPLAVCIKVCEPICADSDYRIGLTIFDQPVAQVSVRGRTRIGGCDDAAAQDHCVDFKDENPDQTFTAAFMHGGLKFTPLTDPLHTIRLGAPAGQVKLSIPPSGLRIDFPAPVSKVTLTLNNYAGAELRVKLLGASGPLLDQMVLISNQERTFDFTLSGATAVEVSGGNNEASLIQVCYRPEA